MASPKPGCAWIKQGISLTINGKVPKPGDPFAEGITDAIAEGVRKAAKNLEETFFLGGHPELRHRKETLEGSPYRKIPKDERLISQEDWQVGYIREFNCVDIYHRHGRGPCKKWHYCVFCDEKNQPLGGTRIYQHTFKESVGKLAHRCSKCHKEVPREIMSAIMLLVEL